jgi:hypothetical protein
MMHDISALDAMNTLYDLGWKDRMKKKNCKTFMLHDTEIIDYLRKNLYIEAGQQCMLFQST